jgi:hypothetical protein
MSGFAYPTPTDTPQNDIAQYVALLLAAIDESLDRPDVWPEGDEDTAQGYMEDLKYYVMELPVISMATKPSAAFTTDVVYQTTSNALTPVDATNLTLSLDTSGGDVLLGFSGSLWQATASSGMVHTVFDIHVDDATYAGDVANGVQRLTTNSANLTSHRAAWIGFTHLFEDLPAGTHTFELQWAVAVSGVTMQIPAGAHFWVKEL